MNTWTDENTGRIVCQLTNLPEGARVPYFRWPRDLPDGRVIDLFERKGPIRAGLRVEHVPDRPCGALGRRNERTQRRLTPRLRPRANLAAPDRDRWRVRNLRLP
jgi:hypothetical protein